jgi:hypothetical protein
VVAGKRLVGREDDPARELVLARFYGAYLHARHVTKCP